MSMKRTRRTVDVRLEIQEDESCVILVFCMKGLNATLLSSGGEGWVI